MNRPQTLLDNVISRLVEKRTEMQAEYDRASARLQTLADAIAATTEEINDYQRGADKLKRP